MPENKLAAAKKKMSAKSTPAPKMQVMTSTEPMTGTPAVTNDIRRDWNAYTLWLEKKGLKGHPSLDTQDNGGKMIDLYRKENPNTLISRDKVAAIQQEFAKYRDWTLNEIRNKRAMLVDAKAPGGRFVEPNENLDGYMKDLSIVDNIAGQRTTSHTFPDRYLQTFNNGQLVKKENLGFATTNK